MEKRLTDKKMTNYLTEKLTKMEKHYQEVMNMEENSVGVIEEKVGCERSYLDYKKINQDEYRYVKLGQLEDIEEELGINLLVLFQALKDGISYTTKSGKKDYYLGWELYLDYDNQCFRNLHEGRQYDPSCDAYDGTGWYEFDDTFDFCDFGKSWEILTREMYENIRKGKC